MKKLLLSVLTIGVLFASCSDDDDKKDPETDPKPNKEYNSKEFIKEKKDEMKQTISLNTSDLPVTDTLRGGTILTIPEGAFAKDGVAITGAFEIEVYEMLKPSDIIFSGTNTNYESQWNLEYKRIFESDGFIYINATQNGIQLDKHTVGFEESDMDKYLTIQIPTEKEDGTMTQLWVGINNAGINEDQFAWTEGEWNDFGMEVNRVESNNNYFGFSLGTLGWSNCDIFWGEETTMTTITVSLTGNVGKLASFMAADGDTYVIFVGKGVRVVNQLYDKVNETTVKSYDDSMPIGKEGRMVAFSVKEGIVSYAEQDITITKDMKLALDLKAVTKAELESKIKALDNLAK